MYTGFWLMLRNSAKKPTILDTAFELLRDREKK